MEEDQDLGPWEQHNYDVRRGEGRRAAKCEGGGPFIKKSGEFWNEFGLQTKSSLHYLTIMFLLGWILRRYERVRGRQRSIRGRYERRHQTREGQDST